MRTADEHDPLVTALGELAALGTDRDREVIAGLRERLASARLRVLVAGAIRRSLPGEIGRRRAREHLQREAADLVPRQVGRARGDLQYRLAEATRALAATVERRYTDATERMQRALRTAAGLREASAAGAGKKEQELAEREAALRHALSLLDQAGKPDSGAATAADVAGHADRAACE